jgi:hypothetical protein
MGSNSTDTPSKNTAELWELMRNFHQYTIHSLMGLLKSKWLDILENQEMFV